VRYGCLGRIILAAKTGCKRWTQATLPDDSDKRTSFNIGPDSGDLPQDVGGASETSDW
jgi:hypothetical protein